MGEQLQLQREGEHLQVAGGQVTGEGVLPARDAVTILGNLIDNAIDVLSATSDLDERAILVDVAADDDQVILTVADTGPGLPTDTADEVFRRGWSTKQSPQPQGRGLGLTLVQQTAAAQGGEVEVDIGPGTTFTVRIPRHRDPEKR